MPNRGKPGPRRPAGGERSRQIDLKAIGRSHRALDFDFVPQSYDASGHTVELILSEGSAVERWYGVEKLATEEAAVDVTRLRKGGIPFLDSHDRWGKDKVLGRLIEVWFEPGRILGRVKFAETDEGQKAEGMVARGEMTGISIGYTPLEWEVRDVDGTLIDPSKQILDIDDNYTFTATRWELLEVSLVSVPADPAAMARSLDDPGTANLRATPMGQGAREITVTRGDASITYRYGASAPQERALPGSTKGKSSMSNRTRTGTRGAPKPAQRPAATRGKRAEPKVNEDGFYVDDDGEYVDEDGKKVDDPVKARSEPEVNEEGYYVDADGNYVDENGDPSEDPVTARSEEDDDEEGSRGARGVRTRASRSAPARSAPGLNVLDRRQMAEMARIGEQARGLEIELDIPAAIERGDTPDKLRKRMFDELHARSKGKGPVSNVSTVRILRDERQGVAGAMEVALITRLLESRGSEGVEYKPKKAAARAFVDQHRDQARQYMDMGFVEIAAECIGHRGHIRNVRQAEDVLTRAFQSTSDFPAIFQNVLNKSLLARYELAVPTYREIATERPFADFRPHPQVRAGDFPALQRVTETGELKNGGSLDSGENVSVVPYGVIFPISRQMLVNDQLGAIDQILGSAGDTVLVFENTTFFAMFNANPVLSQDGHAVFDPNHNNLAAAGSTIGVTSVGHGRASLRAMRSISNLLLNVPPRIILTGPQQETSADQLVATITPQLTSSVNPFSGKLKSVSDANITDSSWYLLADPARVPCFIYGFLNGSSGPRVRTYEPFGIQGVQISLEHDFGVGAIDFRGAYKDPGALPQ